MKNDISAISNAQMKRIRSLRIKKYRDEIQCFVAEGIKCTGELLARFVPEVLVVRDDASVLEGFPQTVRANERQMEQLSSLVTPTDYLAVFRIPEQAADNAFCRLPDRILVLDGVQDPGNLGTIIRTCDWMGVRRILCSRETADCYAPKVVQATMGALARVQIAYTDLVQTLSVLQQNGYQIIGTMLDGENIYTSDALRANEKTGIVMGNEGNGISSAVARLINRRLTIPAFADSHVESLNVSIATAVILSELRRNQQAGLCE